MPVRARPRVAFVTCAAFPRLHEDDAPLADAAAAAGLEVVPAVWDDPAVDWGAFDLVLLRSTWDYHERHGDFLAWVRRAGALARLRNPPEVVAWNTDKTYLRRLAERGVPTVPTRWLAAGARAGLAALLAERGWREAVVKPTVGLGSSGLLRVDPAALADGSAQAHLDGLLANGEAMVQPFLGSLERIGELSLVFFGGAFSHALRKRPPAGEFRVQPYFGALELPATPTAAERAVADAALACVEHDVLYARVDLVAGDDGAPLLMELELIEPSLYFGVDPDAAARFARVLAAAATADAGDAAA
jgi:glutathione synthase/RimK-type ligase-like ATP-grasp enzyme